MQHDPASQFRDSPCTPPLPTFVFFSPNCRLCLTSWGIVFVYYHIVFVFLDLGLYGRKCVEVCSLCLFPTTFHDSDGWNGDFHLAISPNYAIHSALPGSWSLLTSTGHGSGILEQGTSYLILLFGIGSLWYKNAVLAAASLESCSCCSKYVWERQAADLVH